MIRQALGILLRKLEKSGGHSAFSDAALLERFALDQDEAAFAGLDEHFDPWTGAHWNEDGKGALAAV
jgi:hypothetical protein